MKKNEFLKLLNEKLYVNGPEYRGAPHPIWKERCINESRFEDDLRAKQVDCYIEDNTLVINWISQSWHYNTNSLFKEIERWAKYLANKNNLEDIVYIDINLKDRDNTDSDYAYIEIEPIK